MKSLPKELMMEILLKLPIMGCWRGLLLLTRYCNPLFVWNPSTGVHKRLSYSPIASDRSPYSTFYGFGYDESTADYRVVLAWRSPKKHSFRAGSLLNGVIHWLIFPEDGCSAIVAFDLAEKKLQEVHMPADIENAESCEMGVLAGCLSLTLIEIWIMNGVKSSWSKSIILCTDKFHSRYFSPICLTNDAEIVGMDYCTSLLKCNYSGDLLEPFGAGQNHSGFAAA
ncbi:hypothetical protein L6164_025564 [Bauhinia variegata]|uniref:Uncharacterized protein n=1 Tax=Bauhinia variegata TaxID=167791 RepID=A0ACB9M1R7_BAUVA|nr:hypothetical protein L6164_025564 [Bauhinia variegata]